MRGQRGVIITRGARHSANNPAGENDQRKAKRLQFCGRERRRLAALHHVGDQRNALERGRNALELGASLGRFRKQNICARLAVTQGARDRAIEAFDGDRIGAGNNQSFARVARVERRLDLADHFGGRDQHFVVEMAAALRKILVLDLDRVGAGALEQADGALDIEGIAVAGVGIDDQMCAHAVADQRDGFHHLAHAHQADVGPAEPGIGDAGARDVKRVEPGLLCDQRCERVIDAGRDEDRRAGETGA